MTFSVKPEENDLVKLISSSVWVTCLDNNKKFQEEDYSLCDQ